MSSNGESKLDSHDLSIEDKLNLLIEGQVDLANQIELMREEFSEKFSNLSLPGVDYDTDEYDS